MVVGWGGGGGGGKITKFSNSTPKICSGCKILAESENIQNVALFDPYFAMLDLLGEQGSNFQKSEDYNQLTDGRSQSDI